VQRPGEPPVEGWIKQRLPPDNQRMNLHLELHVFRAIGGSQ